MKKVTILTIQNENDLSFLQRSILTTNKWPKTEINVNLIMKTCFGFQSCLWEYILACTCQTMEIGQIKLLERGSITSYFISCIAWHSKISCWLCGKKTYLCCPRSDNKAQLILMWVGIDHKMGRTIPPAILTGVRLSALGRSIILTVGYKYRYK